MTPLLWILLGLGGLASLAGIAQWVIILRRMVRTMAMVPMLEEGLQHIPARWPTLHLIIPAHNEERVIGPLIESLQAQTYPGLRITLALDRCTDQTVSIARDRIGTDPRFTIIEIATCPPDWAGKVHAVHHVAAQALQASDPPALIAFADADVAMHPHCLAACVGLLHQRQLDLLSVLSTLTSDTWFEKIIQPAMTLELIRQFPLLRANGAPARRPFANGQFMLFTRAMYQRIGGHTAVRDELLEDLALARLVGDCRGSSGVFVAGDLLICSMYPTFPAFTRGWRRIYTEAAKCKVSRLNRHALTALWMGTLMPLGCIAGVIAAAAILREPLVASMDHSASMHGPMQGFMQGPIEGPMQGLLWGVLICAGVALVLMVIGLSVIARLGRQSFWSVPLAVVGSTMTAWTLWSAGRELAAGVPVRWAGREYVRKRR